MRSSEAIKRSRFYWKAKKTFHHVLDTSQAGVQTKPKRGAVDSNADLGHAVFSHKQTNGKAIKVLVRCTYEASL